MGGVAKRVLWLSGGSAASQGLLLALVPLIARQTDPATYGLYALVAAGFVTAAGIFTLRLELAIPAARTRLQALESATLAVLLLWALALAATVAVIVSAPLWPRDLYPGDRLLLAAGPAAILFGTHQISRYWATRLGLERRSALAQMLRTAGMLVAQLVLLTLGWGALGLVLGHALGSLLAVAFMSPLWPWRRLPRLSTKRLRRRLRENRDYARFSTPSMAVSALGTHLPVYLLATFFGLSASGTFAVVLRILSAPAGLVSQAVGLVFFSEVSRSLHSDRRIDLAVAGLANSLLPAAAAIYVGVAVFADPVLGWLLGEQWRLAAPIAVSLSLWLALAFVVSALDGLPLVMGRQRALLWLNGAGTALRIGALTTGGLLGSFAIALWGYGLAGALVSLGILLWCFRLAKVERSWQRAFWMRRIAEASLLGLVFWALERTDLRLGTASAFAFALVFTALHLRKLGGP